MKAEFFRFAKVVTDEKTGEVKETRNWLLPTAETLFVAHESLTAEQVTEAFKNKEFRPSKDGKSIFVGTWPNSRGETVAVELPDAIQVKKLPSVKITYVD